MPPIALPAIPVRPATRFAPSPTGYLHLGHVANAVWTWGIARAAGGTVLLRIEDHDRGRCRPEYERGIREDLDWLGLHPDRESRQSDDAAAYQEALDRLGRTAGVYGCRCSRSDIARRTESEPADGEELRYPGTCRDVGTPPLRGVGVRVVMGEETVGFDDLRLGPQRQTPARQCGDLLLRDAAGNWTYQLCVTVDDARQGITLVIRGEDLLSSTGRQILLGEMLGRERPAAFLHHPLIRNEAGTKLSKRDRVTGVRELRAGGRSPESVLGEAAWRSGLLPERRSVGGSEWAALFR
jgi:glutamyl-tRNA synthetase/glutamyl-Q tRNA(Asp) synthetase